MNNYPNVLRGKIFAGGKWRINKYCLVRWLKPVCFGTSPTLPNVIFSFVCFVVCSSDCYQPVSRGCLINGCLGLSSFKTFFVGQHVLICMILDWPVIKGSLISGYPDVRRLKYLFWSNLWVTDASSILGQPANKGRLINGRPELRRFKYLFSCWATCTNLCQSRTTCN